MLGRYQAPGCCPGTRAGLPPGPDCSGGGPAGARYAKRAEARTVAQEVADGLEDWRMDADGYPETWGEAVAAFERAEPVKVVRSPREVTVEYRPWPGGFIALSPQIPGFRAGGNTLEDARRAAREQLTRFLDPAVRVTGRPSPEETAAADELTEKLGLYAPARPPAPNPCWCCGQECMFCEPGDPEGCERHWCSACKYAACPDCR